MWPNPQFPADLVTFTEEFPNGKLHFLCSELKNTSTCNQVLPNIFSKFFVDPDVDIQRRIQNPLKHMRDAVF